MQEQELLNLAEYVETLKKLVREMKKYRRDNLELASQARQTQTLIKIESVVEDLAGQLPCRSGIPRSEVKRMVETQPCHKCNCERGMVVQQLSKVTGRALKKFMVFCENCWNVDICDNTIEGAVSSQNNMNWALKR